MNLKPLTASIALAIAGFAQVAGASEQAANSFRVFSCMEGKHWHKDMGCVADEKAAPAPVQKAAAPVVSNDQRTVMYLPTGVKETSALMIERTAPKEVVAGQPFNYDIKATNLSASTLSNVAVQDMCSSNFKLLLSSPEAARTGDTLNWKLGDLKAGESRTINVNGQIADAKPAQTCLSGSYDQSSCMAFNVVEPKLALAAKAPAEVIRCDGIPLDYTVSNPGTGLTRNASIAQALPEGVSFKDGSGKLAVGDLAPGASRDLKVAVMAAKPGIYEFRPAAAADAGLKADAVATTRVTQPALQVVKKMDDSQLLGRDVNYSLTVTNTGDAVARKLTVEENLPASAKVNSASDNGTVTPGRIVWNLTDLAPQASKTVNVSLRPQALGSVATSARATAYCADAATADGKTAVVGIPAVLLEVIDLTDPVVVGSETTYVIVATNQGTATDINVRIVADLENSMQFVSTSGATTPVATGAHIEFAPLPTLAPGAKAEWRVTAKAVAPADSRFTVNMTSDITKRPVMETEATTLYK